MLGDLYGLLETRINVTGLSLRNGVRGSFGVHVRSRVFFCWKSVSKLADLPVGAGGDFLPTPIRVFRMEPFPLVTGGSYKVILLVENHMEKVAGRRVKGDEMIK